VNGEALLDVLHFPAIPGISPESKLVPKTGLERSPTRGLLIETYLIDATQVIDLPTHRIGLERRRFQPLGLLDETLFH
jgi:hypothetical protein